MGSFKTINVCVCQSTPSKGRKSQKRSPQKDDSIVLDTSDSSLGTSMVSRYWWLTNNYYRQRLNDIKLGLHVKTILLKKKRNFCFAPVIWTAEDQMFSDHFRISLPLFDRLWIPLISRWSILKLRSKVKVTICEAWHLYLINILPECY